MSYDVFSLVSFIDASPVLDSFILKVSDGPHILELSTNLFVTLVYQNNNPNDEC